MISLIEMRRKHTKWSIEQNPVEIVIKRTEKKDMGGFFEDLEETLPPQTVRIFSSKANSRQTITTLAGQKQVDRYFGLLADFEADIKADTHTKDEFEAHGMHFVVKAVFPQTINGEIVGYHCELERVK